MSVKQDTQKKSGSETALRPCRSKGSGTAMGGGHPPRGVGPAIPGPPSTENFGPHHQNIAIALSEQRLAAKSPAAVHGPRHGRRGV